MSKLRKTFLLLGVLAGPMAFASSVRADGCYTCGSGSTDVCKNYCRYQGEDTFAGRKECERRGCRVSGTSSCPTAVNYKVCLAPVASPTTVAAIPWCARETRS